MNGLAANVASVTGTTGDICVELAKTLVVASASVNLYSAAGLMDRKYACSVENHYG